MITKIFPLFTIILITTLSSCGNRKNITYFQDDDESTSSEISVPTFEPKFEVGDLLSVEITGAQDEVIEPFNQPKLVRQGNQISSYDNGIPATSGYLIYSDSTISLPILGRIKVGGLTRAEAIQSIESVLKTQIENPQISIRILNFKVTILGEVENPGTFSIPNERISIIEAIGLSRDLKITGKRKNVLVIRNEDGLKKEYRLDLTSKDLFKSSAYFLKQNDIVYVEPNWKSRFKSSPMENKAGLFVSISSIILTTVALITK